ncbi:hypothetical protein AGR5A_Lc100025 [Agrobacterium genomosp. 5 str. CFBP 6626]|nr:hypothetical protein AGR5A_Lc100025 [Agrobacterium genomosp. 5 str. CFBP 6626]
MHGPPDNTGFARESARPRTTTVPASEYGVTPCKHAPRGGLIRERVLFPESLTEMPHARCHQIIPFHDTRSTPVHPIAIVSCHPEHKSVWKENAMLTTPLDIQPMTEHLVAVIALGSPFFVGGTAPPAR